MIESDLLNIGLALIISYLFEYIHLSVNISWFSIFSFINLLGIYLFLKHIKIEVKITYQL